MTDKPFIYADCQTKALPVFRAAASVCWGALKIAEAERDAARAEIARLTDAEPAPFPQPQRNDGGKPCGECHLKPNEVCDVCGAVAPPPPAAAADRGVPGQRDEAADIIYVMASIANGRRPPALENGLRTVPAKDLSRLCDLAHAALATAPKAEDVRREAIKECAKVADAHAQNSNNAGWALAKSKTGRDKANAATKAAREIASRIRALAEAGE